MDIKETYIKSVISSIAGSLQERFKDSIKEHSEEFFGDKNGGNPVIKIHSHILGHCAELAGAMETKKSKSTSED